MEIADASGAVVHAVDISAPAGHNRVSWDLRHETVTDGDLPAFNRAAPGLGLKPLS